MRTTLPRQWAPPKPVPEHLAKVPMLRNASHSTMAYPEKTGAVSVSRDDNPYGLGDTSPLPPNRSS